MVKQLFYFFHIIFSLTLLDCGEKNILPNFTNSHEPDQVFFGPLKPEPLKTKY